MVALTPENLELEEVRCPLGCIDGDRLLFTARDRLHDLPGTWRVVRCDGCGLIRTTPRPTQATIAAYYPESYRLHEAIGARPSARGTMLTTVRDLVRRVLDLRIMPLPPGPPGRLYEVGCGNGAFLRSMASRGWSVEGLEPSARAAGNARALGLDVTNAPLEQAEPPKITPNLIVARMALEHLHEPIEGLRRLREWAAPGAWLVASVPNARSREFLLFRSAWYALQVPTHLFHFTPETLGKVMARGGWRMERVFHQRVLSNLIASTGNALEDRHLLPRLARRLKTFPQRSTWQAYLLYPAGVVLAALGQTGRITVWARPD